MIPDPHKPPHETLHKSGHESGPRDAHAEESETGAGEAGGATRFTFPRSHRLTHAREFEAVYAGKLRKSAGVVALAALPNGLTHPRLGLSIGRRVGGAVARNRLKRLLREAFRLSQHELPRDGAGAGYDFVVSARAHEPLALERYRELLLELARACDEERRRRETRALARPGGPGHQERLGGPGQQGPRHG